MTVRKVAEEDGLSTGSCHIIISEDLGMHWVPAEFVRNSNDFPSVKISSKEQMTTKIF
jgi:hypothetical protein